MTRYQFEDKLRPRAEEFVKALKTAGLDGAVLEDSFREYSVKIRVTSKDIELGPVVLYYKPKSDSYSIGTHQLRDKSNASVVEDCWHGVPRGAVSTHGYEIYVDGSFTGGGTGYGAVILQDGNVVEELSGAVDSSEVAGTHQVAGELAAVKEALTWCREHSVNEVSIYYDYLGIEKWATGQYKANQPLTQEYARFVRESGIKIRWHKVDSHTGNRWNDRADALAKKGAAGVETAGETDMLRELLEKANAWIEFLMIRGIEASYDRVYNQQFARVYIIESDRATGTFDLYNTRKKRFSPYLHDFRDDELKRRIEDLWKEFLTSETNASMEFRL